MSGVDGLIEMVKHPIDNVLYPIAINTFDAFVIAGACESARDMAKDPREVNDLTVKILQSSELTSGALTRMQEKVRGIENVIDDLSTASGPKRTEAGAEVVTAVLVPGTVVKAVKAVKNMVQLGVPFAPKFTPLLPEIGEKFVPAESIKFLTLADVRTGKYDGFAHLIYVITEDRKLLIAPNRIEIPDIVPKGSKYYCLDNYGYLAKNLTLWKNVLGTEILEN